MYALQVFVCNRGVDEGVLCKVCVKRSLTHPRHEPRLHGLLTEPIPEDSHIFGGAWYTRMVERFGPPDLQWVIAAEVNQKIAEGWIEGAWTAPHDSISQGQEEKAQSVFPLNTKGMKVTSDISGDPKKSTAKPKAKPTPKSKEVTPSTERGGEREREREKVVSPIPHIPILYQETADPIVTLPTDSYTIHKGIFRGKPVWILPNGKMFDMNHHGKPHNLLDELYSE
jgi:hypothetical protein